MFDDWWEKAMKIPANTNECSKPVCGKFAPSICETTFENFVNVDNSLIPEFEGTLSNEVIVERTLGGGKSGAYLFIVRLKSGKSVSSSSFVLKLYANAYNRLGRVQDTRPFREVYTQCAMSGTSGYNCLLGFAWTSWESVSGMFATTTKELYNAKAERNNKLADARMITEFPSSVLFMICTFTNGVPLLNLDLNKYGNAMPGIVLNIMSTHQKADRRVGHFTHWDLHADNIFVDTGCMNRPSVNLAFVRKFDGEPTWKKLYEITDANERGALESFKKETWDPLLDVMNGIVANFKKTGEFDMLSLEAFQYSGTKNQMDALLELQKDFRQSLDHAIIYPTVTLIDFDLANSDKFPELDRIHEAKMNSPLPIAERTLNWLLKWVPASHVIKLIELLLSLRPLIPSAKQSDILHMMLYVIVALIYWQLPSNTNDRLTVLHEKSNFVFTMVKRFVSNAAKLNMDGLQHFLLDAMSNVLPFKCEGPTYCGLSPLLAINYTNWNTAMIGALRSCMDTPSDRASSDRAICQYSNLFKPAIGVLKDAQLSVSNLVKMIHAALLTINIRHFIKKGQFITSDDIQININHVPTDALLYIHAEIPWEEFSQDQSGLTGWIKGSIIERYTMGRFSFGCNMSKDTNVTVQLNNGSDVFASIDTGMEISVYGYGVGIPGEKYALNLSNSENIFVNGKSWPAATRTHLLANMKLKSILISVKGTLTEITIEMTLVSNLANLSASVLHSIIMNIVSRFIPNNVVMSTTMSGKEVKLVMSLPPSDEPVHPCVGFATDYTNLTHALNCVSSTFSMPSRFSKLLSSFELGTEPVLRRFLNEITASIQLKDRAASVPIPIWSMSWTDTGVMQGDFQLKSVPEDAIRSGLTNYLSRYKTLISDKDLPRTALEIYNELPDLSPWQKISTNKESFNLEYVKYLSAFLTEDEFFDAS